MRPVKILLLGIFLFAISFEQSMAQSESFESIGVLEELAGQRSEANAVSADGSVVVGQSRVADGNEAVMWTLENGLVSLGDLPGGRIESRALAISGDGSVVVGYAAPGTGFDQIAAMWTIETGWVSLGDLPGGVENSLATGASFDGSVVVGYGSITESPNEEGFEAFRWTQETGLVGLGDLRGGEFESLANDVSDDGLIIVGRAASTDGLEAFRWTVETGMVGLGDLPGGEFFSTATSISGDGKVIVGSARSGEVVQSTNDGIQAFRWTEETGMVGLGFLPGGEFSGANDVSFDGSVIVGSARPENADRNAPRQGTRAFLWTEEDGLRTVGSALADDGINIGEWQLFVAQGISADGNTIVGTGINPDGTIEGWIARLGVGMVSPADLTASLGSLAVIPFSIDRAIARNLQNALQTARMYGRADYGLEKGALNIWGAFNGEWYDVQTGRDYSSHGAAGFSYQLDSDIRIGIGGQIGSTVAELNAFDGQFDSEAKGINAFAAWEPDAFGPQIYFGLAADWHETEITRGYLNGVDQMTSTGVQDVSALAAGLAAQWKFNMRLVDLAPFAEYEYVDVSFDAYEEIGGDLPARFNQIDVRSHVTRLGLEAQTRVSQDIRLWASGAWAHQFDDDGAVISGEVVPLSMRFATPGLARAEDWADGRFGLSWTPTEVALIEVSGRVANDNFVSANSRVSGGVSLRIALALN